MRADEHFRQGDAAFFQLVHEFRLHRLERFLGIGCRAERVLVADHHQREAAIAERGEPLDYARQDAKLGETVDLLGFRRFPEQRAVAVEECNIHGRSWEER